MPATEPLTLPDSSPRPARPALRSRTLTRRYDLPATARRSRAIQTSRAVQPATVSNAQLAPRASGWSRLEAAEGRTTVPGELATNRQAVTMPARLAAPEPRITAFATAASRRRLLDASAPAALFGGMRTLGSLAASWTRLNPRHTTPAELFGARAGAVSAALLPTPNRRDAGSSGRLRASSVRGPSRAAWLANVPSASSGLPAERVESAAERTGAAVAEAVIASFERLVPSVVARALAEAERRLMSAI